MNLTTKKPAALAASGLVWGTFLTLALSGHTLLAAAALLTAGAVADLARSEQQRREYNAVMEYPLTAFSPLGAIEWHGKTLRAKWLRATSSVRKAVRS